jgi:acyl dehydratase
MPIDPTVALSAAPTLEEVTWSTLDVLLYHLALGAGADPTDGRELAYASESGSAVLPTFAVVVPMLRAAAPPQVSFPGIEVDLRTILHASQRIEVHRPLARNGKSTVQTGVTDLWDKGSAAVIVVDTVAIDTDGSPLWTSSMRMFSHGEGGFGGHRGPSGAPAPPSRAADHVLVAPTFPQQALWYRLLGDRNPLHSDPAVAAAAGFRRPILHGLCTYGIVTRAIADALLGGQVDQVRAVEARFTGVVFPGETLRTSVWAEDGGRIVFGTQVDDRDGAPALSGEVLTGGDGA